MVSVFELNENATANAVASECRQRLHSEQTEKNAGGFAVFSLVGVVAYGREENTAKSNDDGHLPVTFI